MQKTLKPHKSQTPSQAVTTITPSTLPFHYITPIPSLFLRIPFFPSLPPPHPTYSMQLRPPILKTRIQTRRYRNRPNIQPAARPITKHKRILKREIFLSLNRTKIQTARSSRTSIHNRATRRSGVRCHTTASTSGVWVGNTRCVDAAWLRRAVAVVECGVGGRCGTRGEHVACSCWAGENGGAVLNVVHWFGSLVGSLVGERIWGDFDLSGGEGWGCWCARGLGEA